MYMVYGLISFIILHFFDAVPVVAQEAECGRGTYGTPLPKDCLRVLNSFANPKDTTIRGFFNEEQQRFNKDGSWPGLGDLVRTDHLNDVVQLPRYYTLSR